MSLKARRYIISLALFTVVVGIWSLSAKRRSTETVVREIAMTFSVQNNSNDLLEHLVLKVSTPARNSGSQVVQNISLNIPSAVTTDRYGNSFDTLEIALPPYGSKSISLNATIGLMLHPTEAKIESPDFVGDLPALSLKSPEIQSLAQQLKGTTARALAHEVYELVRGALTEGRYDAEDRGAVAAIKAHSGDCTEFASLTVALLRAKNIPSRRVAGYVVKSNQVLDSAALHNWAEFYADETWHILDPYLEVFDQGYAEYLSFQVEAPPSEGALAFGERLRVSDPRVTVKLN